jgi:hypothetical protein
MLVNGSKQPQVRGWKNRAAIRGCPLLLDIDIGVLDRGNREK